MNRTVDVIVLGTGTAAQNVAYTCREAGWSVAVVDSRPFGGTCSLRGCDPKKVLVGMLLLFGVESGLAPLQLALSRAVIDSLAAPVGRTAALDPIVTHVPLAAWIALTLAVVTLGQLIAPLIAMLQSQTSDRLTGYITEQVMQAANRWQGLARFEDPGFADDLKRAREAANREYTRLYRLQAVHYLDAEQEVDQ